MLIRPYRDSDAPAVRELFVRVNRELAPPEMRGRFEEYIAIALRDEIDRIGEYYAAGPGRGFWIAENDDGGLIGMFGLEATGADGAELRRMYVAPERRRRGVARALLAEAERLSIRAGLRRLVLSTSELQAAALALYRGAGFQLLREEVAGAATHKIVGSGLRRFYFEKILANGTFDGQHR
jgi:GNAT superfamily N-acetyltransferase